MGQGFLDKKNVKTVLIIAPHLDDEVLGCGVLLRDM